MLGDAVRLFDRCVDELGLPVRRDERLPRKRHGSPSRSEEHTSELQSPCNLVCRLLLEKKKTNKTDNTTSRTSKPPFVPLLSTVNTLSEPISLTADTLACVPTYALDSTTPACTALC